MWTLLKMMIQTHSFSVVSHQTECLRVFPLFNFPVKLPFLGRKQDITIDYQ